LDLTASEFSLLQLCGLTKPPLLGCLRGGRSGVQKISPAKLKAFRNTVISKYSHRIGLLTDNQGSHAFWKEAKNLWEQESPGK